MTFINYDQEQMSKCKASSLAYRLRSLIAVSHCAFENDSGSVNMDQRGIEHTLEVAEQMACDLIDMCEEMERVARTET